MKPLPFYASLGQRIHALRTKKKMTQKKLADAARLSRTSITNIEKGRQKVLVHTLVDLASALGTDVRKLFPKIVDVKEVEIKSDKIKHLPNDEKKWVLKIQSKEMIK